ncbi:hypothetical protein BURPS305_4043 [Burkholderia pseudomallei 305]|nr:hypothetical protein BURPS305_4043 [Burkholderia pseudomallei 305]
MSRSARIALIHAYAVSTRVNGKFPKCGARALCTVWNRRQSAIIEKREIDIGKICNARIADR